MAGKDDLIPEIVENTEATADAVAVTAEGDEAPVDQANAPNAVTDEAERQDHHDLSTTFALNADGGHEDQQEVEGSSAVDGGGVGIITVNVGSSSLLEVGVRKRKSTVLELVGGNSSAGGGSSSSSKQSRLVEPAEGREGVVIRCAVCGREFPSWKALFGHMRTHPDRPWRGVFPPPNFNPEGSPEQPQQQEQRGLGIDLNVEDQSIPLPSPPPSPVPPPPPSSPKMDEGGASGGLDLNFPPPPEEE